VSIQFIPTDEQVMLRDSLRRWAADRDVRQAEDFDTTWRFAAEQGWLMAGQAEELGGLGGNAFDTAIIAQEFGRALVRAPYVEIAGVAAALLARLVPDRVAELVAGARRPILAHDEPAARGETDWVETTAAKADRGWMLTGRKTGVVGAGHADSFLITARIPGSGIALFEIAAELAPVRCFTTFDDRSGGEIDLVDTSAIMVADPDETMIAVRAALDHGLVLEAAETLGAIERALEMTREYLLTRQQYGQLIGNFQALRHRLADMFIETEQARSIVLRGLAALGEEEEPRRMAMAAAVKARVAQAALFVSGNAIQLHGGIGVTEEYPVGHFFKRALAFDQRHGGGARQVERFSELSIS
jgi:alkylation response protein AidB-like acyl-CoA dehydrogenase